MPRRPNKYLRIFLPLGLFVVGLGIPIAVGVNTMGRKAAQPIQTPAEQPSQAAAEGAPTETTGQPADAGAAPAQADPAGAPPAQPIAAVPAGTYAVESLAGDPLATDFDPIGGLGLDSPFRMRVEFSHLGAGVRAIRLAGELDSVQSDREAKKGVVDPEHHVVVQAQVAGAQQMLVPFCALGLEINGSFVQLLNSGTPDFAPAWRQVSREEPGRFEAFIRDAAGNRVLRVERRYLIAPGSHDLEIRQRVENLTDGAFDLRWNQFGPVELFAGTGYGGEIRRMRFGYLLDAQRDPTRQWVDATDYLWSRKKFTGKGAAKSFPGQQVWPNSRGVEKRYDLVWLGMTNRYFGAVVHPIIDPAAVQPDKVFHTVERVDYVTLPDTGDIVFRLASPAGRLEPGATADYDMGLYAGPLSREVIGADAMLDRLGVPGVVVFNFGSMCAFCTFSWLTGPLLGLLRFLHSLTSDWALSIILLVVCVRTLLHPITRWSQLRMLIFGKQMQGMAPKQKLIQEKYKDDKQRLQQEMSKLWREEGISPTGFLGCLPMFLQSPVWIALYAMLYFAIDLRHEPAFFGVFQSMTGNAWLFLADLAEPDRAIFFGSKGPTLPMVGKLNSINLLPLLLGVVFFMQQKYLQPPTTAAMTPEQESQQKMMKVMMVVMFPLIMYGAPSGLAIYFITNSVLGILESRWIRSHAAKTGQLEPDALKKKPSKGGFMGRLKAMAEAQQANQAQRGTSAKRQPRMVKDPGPTPRRYKKR
jgi:YidC/Oxa1 family membrane protein insertase